MRIAIPSTATNMRADVCVSFGRAPYFLIFDTETNEERFIVNPGAGNTGGAGIKAAQTVVDQKTEVLLTPRCGENALTVLRASGVEIYRTVYGSLEENIALYRENKLPLLTEVYDGFRRRGRR